MAVSLWLVRSRLYVNGKIISITGNSLEIHLPIQILPNIESVLVRNWYPIRKRAFLLTFRWVRCHFLELVCSLWMKIPLSWCRMFGLCKISRTQISKDANIHIVTCDFSLLIFYKLGFVKYLLESFELSHTSGTRPTQISHRFLCTAHVFFYFKHEMSTHVWEEWIVFCVASDKDYWALCFPWIFYMPIIWLHIYLTPS